MEDRQWAKWLECDEPECKLLQLCSMPNCLDFFIDQEAHTAQIPADTFCYNGQRNKWYILDDRGQEI